ADAWGDPENPLSAADVEAKLRALVAWGGLEAEEADAALRCCAAGDAEPVAPLLDLVGRWVA
ncbi:MAG: hypothetical protein ACK4MT_10690, partial [Thermaurantiacus tibetensis]